MNNPIWVPFETKPCPSHGWACGGIDEPRYDLPVFISMAMIMSWMIDPANQHIHSRNGQHVLLHWEEHTREEAMNLGFLPPTEDLH